MIAFGSLLLVIGFLGCAVAMVMTLVRLVARKSAKTWLWCVGAGVALFTVGAFIASPGGSSQPVVAKTAANAARSSPRRPTFPSYLELRAGQHAILDSNNEGDGARGTLFDDLPTARKWLSGQFSEPAELHHHDLPVGTPVVVRAWTHIRGVDGNDHVVIDVATLGEPRREGYVQDISLLPAIPLGTPLLVRSSFRGGRGVSMTLKRDGSAHPPSVVVPDGTEVSLLSVAPDGEDISPYRAEVRSGPHRGLRGWFNVFSLRAHSAATHVDDYDPKCRCVGLYLSDLNAPATPVPTAQPTYSAETQEDKDYMQEACMLAYDGAGYAYDNEAVPVTDGNMRILACKSPGGDLVYFRREHRAETKDAYNHDPSPPGTAAGFQVPPLGTADATPFPMTH